MCLIVRTEPVGKKFMEGYPQLKEILQKAQWLNFIEKFDGFHKEVTKYFARAFDRVEVKVGDIKFAVIESLVAEATVLPNMGERWFKNRGIIGEEWKAFLKKPGMDTSIFKKGIPSTTLKGKWREMLFIIQKFITCEGRFGCMFFYHARVLMNFLEDKEINLPYFLLNSLRKMAGMVQKRIYFIDNTMYHHALIKLLIEFHLKIIGDTWEDFITRNHFQEI